MSDYTEINAEVYGTEALTADVSTNESINISEADVDEVADAIVTDTEMLTAEVYSNEFTLVGIGESVGSGDSGGGSSGEYDYNDLINKPQIEGVVLVGNKLFPELNLNTLSNTEIQSIFDNLI